MATEIRMPEVLAGVTEAIIAAWSVAVGDTVAEGAPLAEIETDKALVDYTAEVGGTVLALLVGSGETVPVGARIAVIGEPGEQVEEMAPEPDAAVDADQSPAAASSHAAPAEAPMEPVEGPRTPAQTRQFASPLVRRLAKERGIDLNDVVGSGPHGRIVRLDLDALQAPVTATPATPPATQPATQPAFDEVPLTRMRRTIADRLTEAKQSVPHFYLAADVRVDRLWRLRDDVNSSSGVKVSFNDLVIMAVAAALRTVPQANAVWGGDVIRQHRDVDVAMAVSVDGGLVTPVLRGVDRMTLREVVRQSRDLADRARSGRLRQHELEGGSFSISNLGMYGVEEFSAIINPPHSGILAVGAIREAPVAQEGEVVVGKLMRVTLSADHRVLDGAAAAQWLAAFVAHIENPVRLLI